MIRSVLFAAALSVLPCAPALAYWVCTPEQTAGFVYNNGNWEKGEVAAGNFYTIRRSRPEDVFFRGEKRTEWVVVRSGEARPSLTCSANDLVMRCSDFARSQELRFNKRSLRFLITQLYGFWTDDLGGETDQFRAGAYQPYVALGHCAKR